MALLFCDSFDHYATNDITKKWDATYGTIDVATADPRRSGSQYVTITSYSSYLRKDFTPSGSTIILGLAFYIYDVPRSTNINYGFWVLDSSLSAQVALLFTPALGFSLHLGTNSGSVIATSANGLYHYNTWNYLEWKITVGNSGSYEVRLNGISVFSGSGVDTQNQADSSIGGIKLHGCHTGTCPYIDDLYILDDSGADNNDFIGDCRVDALWPSGAGNYSQWTPSAGSNYECVDDSDDITDDTDYVSTSGLNNLDSYAFDDLSALSTSIFAVAANLAARKDDTGAREISPVARIASSDYVGTAVTLDTSYAVFQNIWENNPDDAAAWEEADVNGAEFGIKLTA